MTDGERKGVSEFTGSEFDVSLETLPLHSTNLLTVLDEDGVIRYESPSITHILGFTQDELVGERVAEYFHPEEREEVVEAFQHVVSGEEYAVEAVEYRHEQSDGTYCWVESVASTNPTPRGQYVVNTCDISERKQREQLLKQKNDRLGEFASVISHDLRNPLTVAQGHVSMLQEECDSGHLDPTVTALNRMETIIEETLSLARQGNTVTESEPVEVPKLVGQCWEMIDSAEAALEIVDEPVIRGDRERLRHVFENMFRNAVEHAGSDVTVRIGRGGETVLFVEDDGPGISPAERETVVEPGHISASGGVGYGLMIVKRIAEAHGWELTITEGTSGGARFEFSGVQFVE